MGLRDMEEMSSRVERGEGWLAMRSGGEEEVIGEGEVEDEEVGRGL